MAEKCKNCFSECKNNKIVFAEVTIINRGTTEDKWIHTKKGKGKLNACDCGCFNPVPVEGDG